MVNSDQMYLLISLHRENKNLILRNLLARVIDDDADVWCHLQNGDSEQYEQTSKLSRINET